VSQTTLTRVGSISVSEECAHPFEPARSLVCATPADEVELAALVELASRERLTTLTIGGGTKLGSACAPESLDLLISTARLSAVLAFEPGDGTLTAQGGAALEELAALAASGQRALVPHVPTPGAATLGGAIATGQPGVDRLRRGPLRDHVLGLRVLLANGRSSKSGGRLVKNVAGYDLHRLHAGAWGGLGVILEATLRLFPANPARQSLVVEVQSVAAGIERAFAVRAARLGPERVHLELGAARPALVVTFAGRTDVVEGSLAAGKRLFGGELSKLRDSAPPHLTFSTLPSNATELAHLAEATADIAPGAELTLDPLVAQLGIRLPEPAAIPDVRGLGRSPDVQLWPRARRTESPWRTAAADALGRKLEAALDPEGVWAKLV